MGHFSHNLVIRFKGYIEEFIRGNILQNKVGDGDTSSR